LALTFVVISISPLSSEGSKSHEKPSTGNTKVLALSYGKPFCINFYAWDSLHFGRNLTFKHVNKVDMEYS
jgi:hypothetical protein